MNYDSVYENALDELSGKVDLSWVKSCVAMGTGDGQREFQFARRFLPNLRTLIAVEPDHESVLAFRTSVKVKPILVFIGVMLPFKYLLPIPYVPLEKL